MDWERKIDIISMTMERAGCSLTEDQRLVLIGCLCGMEISEPQIEEETDYNLGWKAYHNGYGISDAFGDCLYGTEESAMEWHRGFMAALEADTDDWKRVR